MRMQPPRGLSEPREDTRVQHPCSDKHADHLRKNRKGEINWGCQEGERGRSCCEMPWEFVCACWNECRMHAHKAAGSRLPALSCWMKELSVLFCLVVVVLPRGRNHAHARKSFHNHTHTHTPATRVCCCCCC